MNETDPRTPPFAELSPDLNRSPLDPKHIHLMGICGTGMASLAGMLKSQGHKVTGSDQNVYPPMSDFLRSLAIPVMEGYRAENLAVQPDLVIVGNVITRLNPEAMELSRLKIHYLSMPQALRVFAMKGKRKVVVCGTHGKTTTTSLIAWILDRGGKNPGFMIGGIPVNFGKNFRIGEGSLFVIEGDEYDTAFFDKGPKFLHYDPNIAVITSIEFDHADIYRDLEHVVSSFRKFISLLPPEGILIINGDDPLALAEAARAKCPLISYGFGESSEWRADEIVYEGSMTRFGVLRSGKRMMTVVTTLYGKHNISNLLSSIALAEALQIKREDLLEALASFRGVKRRQEIKGEVNGILVLDDFAHHPTAVTETIRAVRERFRNRRLMAVFEPRSNSSRTRVFQKAYSEAFDTADLVLIPAPPFPEKTEPSKRFSSEELAENLRGRGLEAIYCRNTDLLLAEIIGRCRAGDAVLFMSNGSFDGLPDRLLQALKTMSF